MAILVVDAQAQPGTAGVFATPGAAVAAAQDGDVIEFMPGTYTCQINIVKSITLRPRTVAGGAGTGPIMLVSTKTVVVRVAKRAKVEIQGITLSQRCSDEISAGDNIYREPVCVRCIEHGNLKLVGCVLISTAHVIMALQEAVMVATRCSIGDAGGSGMVLLGRAKGRLEMCRVQNVTLAGVDVRNKAQGEVVGTEGNSQTFLITKVSGAALRTTSEAKLVVQNASVSDIKGSALLAMDKSEVTFRAVAIEGCGDAAVFVSQGAQVTAAATTIRRCNSSGVSVSGSAQFRMEQGCLVDSCGYVGVYLYGSCKATLADTTVSATGQRAVTVLENAILNLGPKSSVAVAGSSHTPLACVDRARLNITASTVTHDYQGPAESVRAAGEDDVATPASHAHLTHCAVSVAGRASVEVEGSAFNSGGYGMLCRGDSTVKLRSGCQFNTGWDGVMVFGRVRLERKHDCKFESWQVGRAHREALVVEFTSGHVKQIAVSGWEDAFGIGDYEDRIKHGPPDSDDLHQEAFDQAVQTVTGASSSAVNRWRFTSTRSVHLYPKSNHSAVLYCIDSNCAWSLCKDCKGYDTKVARSRKRYRK